MLQQLTGRYVQFLEALRIRIEGELRTDDMARALYGTDASLYKIKPIAILIPKSENDVVEAVRLAARHQVPVLPRGAGSSLAGQAVGEALIIDLTTHLDQILEIDPDGRTVRVQAGAVIDRVNRAVRPHGLNLGPDPASSNRATIGGMVANNATGTHSLLYGNTVQHIVSMRVVLADGTIARFDDLDADAWMQATEQEGVQGDIYRGLDALISESREVIERDTPRHWRRNNGYRIEHLLKDKRNLGRLICGSEGTLGVLLDVTLRLEPLPKVTGLGVVHFSTRERSLRSVTAILETQPSAVELFDGVAIEQARRSPGFAEKLTFIEGDPGAVLITEYFGNDPAEIKLKLAELQETIDAHEYGYSVVHAIEPEEITNVWDVRKEGLGLVMGVKGDYKPVALIEDASVPVEHLADYIEDLEALMEKTNTRAAMYAHAAAGCLHVRPFINTREQSEVDKMRDLAFGSMELVKKYGGTVSSEHGDGIVRAWLTEPLVGPELYDVYRRVKKIFDPNNVLNPGKVVDALPMTENLRIAPDYETIPFREELDWSADGGFARSVELCNGNGLCRKLDAGVMCPSFMATRDEEHSTRGRANALRSALSGDLPEEELTGERMYEVLDLCVQCKGCKVECPSNVDMARMKTEWLGKYYEANGTPLRTRFFAHMARMSRRLVGPAARVTNFMNRRPAIRKAMEKTIGITAERELPEFAAEPFDVWFRKQKWTATGDRVVLFADTFHNFNSPEIAKAAAMTLDRLGFQVVVADTNACCGRTYLSKGFIPNARNEALNTLDILANYIDEGLPIIGLEPSCILTFRDEFLALLPNDERAKKLASLSMMFEQFITNLSLEGRLDHISWTSEARHVLIHGHCHQKALVGTSATVASLSLPPNYTVEVVDSSCCGMAGAFGYEKEHVDVSRKMAELRLAPAVRAASPETLIAAPGTSCRAQIHETAQRKAQHPAEILLAALA